ncbi:SUMF1/EgtB/PvdO family nonheme iron enzyme, partial [bacterium]|nr:SUMF1/EgtB/PvdO family nonheme iron enzyme [candidate division CSSED10-310 bacterium]
AGNVWEWCSSLYKEYPYNPDDGREDPSKTGYRVIRGGGWDSLSLTLRCALRSYYDAGSYYPSYGFRCAKSHESNIIEDYNQTKGTE